MLGGLGATAVAYVDRPDQCPSGTRAKTVVWSYDKGFGLHYECLTGESWWCEWFGINCAGVAPPPLPAPGTREQMTDPAKWTPDTVAGRAAEDYSEAVLRHFEGTSGVARFQSGAHEGLEQAEKPVNWVLAGIILGAVGLIALKRSI